MYQSLHRLCSTSLAYESDNIPENKQQFTCWDIEVCQACMCKHSPICGSPFPSADEVFETHVPRACRQAVLRQTAFTITCTVNFCSRRTACDVGPVYGTFCIPKICRELRVCSKEWVKGSTRAWKVDIFGVER